jgi:hypothetical protein
MRRAVLDPTVGSGGRRRLDGAARCAGGVDEGPWLDERKGRRLDGRSGDDVLGLSRLCRGRLARPFVRHGGIATIDFPGFTATAAALVLDPARRRRPRRRSARRLDLHRARAARRHRGARRDVRKRRPIVHDIGGGAPPRTWVRLADGKLLASAGGYVGAPAQFTGVLLRAADARTGQPRPDVRRRAVFSPTRRSTSSRNLLRTPDGKVVGVGTRVRADHERYDLDGNHDPSFANGGELETTLEGNLDYPRRRHRAGRKIAVTGDEYAACEPMNCDGLYHQAAHFYRRPVRGGLLVRVGRRRGPCESCGAAGACAFGPRTSASARGPEARS